MISQDYLDYVDVIGYIRGYQFDNKEQLLEGIQYNWGWLKAYWPLKDTSAKVDCLLNLAEMSYELLQRLTDQEWNDLISAVKELHEKKNAGYSPEDTDSWRNFRECTEFGITAANGCLVRLCDKFRRFYNVYNNPDNDQVLESAIDTLRDLAAYSIILICLLEEGN